MLEENLAHRPELWVQANLGSDFNSAPTFYVTLAVPTWVLTIPTFSARKLEELQHVQPRVPTGIK